MCLRPRTLILSALLAMPASACVDSTPTDAGPDGGSAGDDASAADAGGSDSGTEDVCDDGEPPGPTGCSVPDQTCPEAHPHPGGPCRGALECPYPVGDEYDTVFTYTCRDGRWDVFATCDEYYYWYCDFTPPLVETCNEPFDGEIDGALVRIGPASVTEPFRPYERGERVNLVTGGQGAAMIEFRLQIGCIEDPPECVLLQTRVSISGRPEMDDVKRVRLHCGESLSVWAVVPCVYYYYEEEVDLDISVDVHGVGTAREVVRVSGATCSLG